MGFCQNLTPLRFWIPVETLKLNKMAVFAWINLKIKICELYSTSRFSEKNSKKCDFRTKNAQKNGKNIFFQQQTLFLYRIHWFMHKNQV